MSSEEDIPESQEGDLYGDEMREQLVEDDELSPTEAAFMRGYGEAI